ncbi:zinc-dependent peptidase [Arthrospiribacter ruber]|uniref:DgsA anti-repressor MtfA n=1 Tax=Arthrospiribacter ruber TaxID=2487934 RepID=A0A951J053_9BACT|nr:zinc-dependent peptidase [Arthrospiribacter ruber]MBW3470233.1 DgsA anti-repressor MtfA [Arthrospiribacter ruber]
MHFLHHLSFSIGEFFYTSILNLKVRSKIQKLSKQDVNILENLFPYYKNLRAEHKKDFISRLEWFIAEKEFVARGALQKVTPEMKLLIGATAIMVTFGFKGVFLRHFRKILIYPDSYYSTINQQYHYGEVNPKLGMIVLSWEKFVEGFMHSQSGVNLGIHEMAHAMKLENQIHYNRESNFFNPHRWETYAKEASLQQKKILNGDSDFFRASAAKNMHEFFAVALEVFFEKPREFSSYNPTLYKSLVYLLKQDPLTLSGKGNERG